MDRERAPRGENRNPSRLTLILVLIFASPLLLPLTYASGEPRFESSDFDILDELNDMLEERKSFLGSNSASSIADSRIDAVRDSVISSDPSSPVSEVGPSIDGLSMVSSSPPAPQHPEPYDLLLTGGNSPGMVDNIWQTLFNITDYVIWTQYVDVDGQITERYEVISFTASLFSLLDVNTESLLHEMDVDGDGDDDIQVGLRVNLELIGGFGIEEGALWIEPGVEFTVKEIGSSGSDPDWENMQALHVSLIKAFSYSDSGTLLNLGGGESYIWVIDSRFTSPPKDFTFTVGIERLYFDVAGGAQELFDTLFETLLNPFNPTPPDESGITFSSIASPYSLRFDNSGQDECSQSYSTSELYTMSSLDISCGVSAGFGYIHFSPPDDDGDRRMWELAYIEARFHPHGESKLLPRDAELVVRTDSVLPISGGLQGEKSLTTLEYWADRRSDLHIHFHEDRSDLPESESDGSYGNTTDSLGWLRGMPAGSLEQDEIERAFRMLGSTDQPELPGDIPNELGLIIGIKNFTRDSSQNVDDPTLPINPADPPDSLIVVRSVQPLQEIDYTSWFSRGGKSDDHRRVHVFAESLPSAVAVYGSFGIGGAAESNDTLDSGNNLDFVSKIVDSVILNLVDVFLDVGDILNEVPSTVVELIGGSVDSVGTSGREMHLLMTDTWLASRNPFPLSSFSMQVGSSDHVSSTGNHVILSRDRDLGICLLYTSPSPRD